MIVKNKLSKIYVTLIISDNLDAAGLEYDHRAKAYKIKLTQKEYLNINKDLILSLVWQAYDLIVS